MRLLITSRVARVALLCAALGGAAACATAPARTRAEHIRDSDADAARALAGESEIDPARIPARAFAVLPFTTSATDSVLGPLGFAMSDLMASDLAQSHELRLVERTRLDAILRELSLIDEGVTDPHKAPRVGKLIGARRILIGNISSEPGGGVILTARIVDVIAGTVQPLVSGRAPLARIIDAEKALALRVFEELGITLSPAIRAVVEQRQTTNLQAIVAYGRGIRGDARGDAAAADTAFQDAARLDVGFAAARAQLVSDRAAGTGAGRAGAKPAGIQRMLDLSSQAINAPVSASVPDAASGPLSAQSSTVPLVITVRIP